MISHIITQADKNSGNVLVIHYNDRNALKNKIYKDVAPGGYSFMRDGEGKITSHGLLPKVEVQFSGNTKDVAPGKQENKTQTGTIVKPGSFGAN
jgi:hypothetical protein